MSANQRIIKNLQLVKYIFKIIKISVVMAIIFYSWFYLFGSIYKWIQSKLKMTLKLWVLVYLLGRRGLIKFIHLSLSFQLKYNS